MEVLFYILEIKILRTVYLYFIIPFFFGGGTPATGEISWARDQTHTTAMTQAMAVTTPDPQPLGHQGTLIQLLLERSSR